MSRENENVSIVLDTGGDSVKFGFANEEKPRFILPSKVGQDVDDDCLLIGERLKTTQNSSNIKLNYPIDRGFVKNWSHLESLFTHLYEDCLQIESDEYTVLSTEPPNISHAQREKFAQVLFEKLKVPHVCFKNSAVLALHSYGQKTGLIVDIGNSVSYVVPVFDGNALNHSSERFNIGGRDITNFLANYLELDKDLSRHIKEKCCYVNVNDDNESKENFNFNLPDGKILNLNPEQLNNSTEILFKPILIDMDIMGLHEVVYKTIAKAQIDLRRDLYANICLSGGSSLLKNMDKRILFEVKKLAPKSVDINVKANNSRDNASWVGGASIASSNSFTDMCVSLSEYKENGPSILIKKFS
jgi:actin-related protein